MPKANLKFKERDVRRAIRAVTKEGIAIGRVAIDPRWQYRRGRSVGNRRQREKK
jgi:hypothetical protein